MKFVQTQNWKGLLTVIAQEQSAKKQRSAHMSSFGMERLNNRVRREVTGETEVVERWSFETKKSIKVLNQPAHYGRTI